jgi:DNA-binding transcriptional LysR family regulator
MAVALKSAWPTCAVQVRIGNARETLGWLTDAAVDAAIVSDPPGDNNLFYEPLFADRLMVALAVDHPLGRAPAFPLAAFAEERVLAREPTSRTRAAFERLLAGAGVLPADMLELQNREAIREGVAARLGVGVFVSSECPPDPRIRYLPIEGAEHIVHMTGHIVCPVERRRTTLGRAVLAAAATLRELSPLPLSRAASRSVDVIRPQCAHVAEIVRD